MKMLAYIIEMAFAIAMTFGFCAYVGHLLGSVVVGIFIGFGLSMAYLFWAIYKNLK